MKFIAMLMMLAATAVMAAEPSAPVTKATTDQQNASATFVRKVTQDGLLEIEAGKLALTKSADANVKAFAQQMIDDHGNASAQLQKIAGAQYQVPTKLDADHQAKFELLMTKSGSEFDQLYGTAMVQDHQAAIKLLTSATSDAAITPELQKFAMQTLPTLQRHHEMSVKLPGAETAK